MRTAVLHASDVAGMRAPRLLGTNPDLDNDPVLGHAPMAGARNLRIWIGHRGHHAGDAGADDGVDAGRGLAMMRARLEGRVQYRGAGMLSGSTQRLGFGMRPSTWLGPAAADDATIFHDDPTNRRIGPGTALPPTPERQREGHETRIVETAHRCGVRQPVVLHLIFHASSE